MFLEVHKITQHEAQALASEPFRNILQKKTQYRYGTYTSDRTQGKKSLK